jgi:hypothetical protein
MQMHSAPVTPRVTPNGINTAPERGHCVQALAITGDPGMTRTCDLRFRKSPSPPLQRWREGGHTRAGCGCARGTLADVCRRPAYAAGGAWLSHWHWSALRGRLA